MKRELKAIKQPVSEVPFIKSPPKKLKLHDVKMQVCLDGWFFDPSYFHEVEINDSEEDGTMVIFRIMKDNEEKFLHLYNCHNGYYTHGFEMRQAGVVLRKGKI